MTFLRRAAIIVVLLLAGTPASPGSEQRVRPPQFESPYEFPATTAPPPPSDVLEYVDLAVLLAALAAASYFALKRRSRKWLLALTVFSLLYFGFWRAGCVCPVGAVQNVSSGLFDGRYVVPPTIVGFFVLPLVFTLFFGRTFCAAVCPLGAVQELVAVKPVRVPAWLEHALGLAAYVYLAAAVLLAAMGSAYVICRADPFVPLFRVLPIGHWVHAASGNTPGGAAGISGRADLLIPTAVFLLIGLFIARPYCRFLCPLGAILRLLSRLSRWHVTITPAECIKCRLCENSCPYGAIRKPTPQGESVGRPDRLRLAGMLVLLPMAVAGGGLLGWGVSGQLAKVDYTVQLAQRIRLEQAGLVSERTDQSLAFEQSKVSVDKLYANAQAVKAGYSTGSAVAGAFVGLVVVLKLLALSVQRNRQDYFPDRAVCMSCARCFSYCPIERQRVVKGHLPVITKVN